MEVTTVSPSPASPPEGDDLCETDVTKVAIHSVTLLISLCGLVGNGAVLHLLSLKDHNGGIFDTAFSDFIFLLFAVPSSFLFLVDDVSCSPVMPLLFLTFLFQLSVVTCYWALFRLLYASDIFYMEMLCRLCCQSNIHERLSWLLYSVQYWAFFALLTVIPAVTNLCPSHQQEHCRAALISMHALILLLCAAPVVISSTIDLIKCMRGSKEQRPKRRNMIIFLMVLFIFLICLFNFLQQLGYIVVSSQDILLINCIQSSIKPFIYFLAGRCWGPCSLRSLQLSFLKGFNEEKEKAAHSSDAPWTQWSEPGDPFHSSAEGP
ncbi:uncharacterized protein FYW23_004680 [Sylvia borin]